MSAAGAAGAGASGRLLVCPTPIGNLEDVTLRVLEALRTADVVACEDTRHTLGLLQRHGIRARRLVSYHEHNEAPRARELVARMQAGETVALVSDAGMPVVSDPGGVLIAAAQAALVEVTVLPGPSAALTALVASGLPAEDWRFVGFLPRKAGELRALLGANAQTLVAYESPRRTAQTVQLLADLDPERSVALCRELTKLHEEVVRATAAGLAAQLGEVRGEVVLVIGAALEGAADLEAAVAAVAELVAAGAKTRTAARVVAGLTGTQANALYAGAQDYRGPGR